MNDDDPGDPRLGHVTLHPQGPVVAGTVGEWTLVYTVGAYGIDEGGTIKLARRFAGDWQRPQFDDPTAPAYCSVTTTGHASLAARYDPKAHVRPWMKCIVIDVYDGCLAPGDVVTIRLGDSSGGSVGIRAQSFIESAHEIRVLVDPTNACLVRRVPSSPSFPIVAGPAQRLVALLPTRAAVGEAVEVFIKGEDAWGNPTPAPSSVSVQWQGDARVELHDGTLRGTTEGSGKVVVSWDDRQFESNPLTIAASPTLRHYWADLHAQSDATVGTGSEVEYFEFGRRWAHLDVMSHQGNDFQMTDEDWQRLNDVVRMFHEDGRFVVFPGFEWSANTPAGGDRNVLYLEEDLPIFRSSHWQIPQTPEDERSPAHPANVLFERLHEHVDPDKVLVAAHCGGRYADILSYYDESLSPLVEVSSCWGVFEWLLWDAYAKGYRVGVMCNSDGHKGRPGAEGPGAGQFGIYGGLTCVLAPSLTRAAVFEALKQRRCYGTTGPRIDLEMTADGHPMGSILDTTNSVKIEAAVHGTGPIESLQLYAGTEPVHTVRPATFDECGGSTRVRVVWGGARIRGRGRRATWDGSVRAHGPRIERVEPFAFDSPADGVLRHEPDVVNFRSRTTGDIDGLDLWLDQAQTGRLVLETGVGQLEVDLATLDADGTTRDFGGLGLHARMQRYPEQPEHRRLALHHAVTLDPGVTTPLMIKVTQVDGHMAWSSPVYCTPS